MATPVTLKIKFKSATFDQFMERYAVDVSRGGIFIRTKQPLAVGTPLNFEFTLQDGSPLLAGDGTVIWIREADAARPSVAAGMGVRFDKLQPASQGTLERILAQKEGRAPRSSSPPSQPSMPAPAPPPQQTFGGGEVDEGFSKEATRVMMPEQAMALAAELKGQAEAPAPDIDDDALPSVPLGGERFVPETASEEFRSQPTVRADLSMLLPEAARRSVPPARVSEPPKAEPPKVEPPKAEPPKAEPPKAEPPKAEPPKAEPPKAEPPKAEPPKAEPPKAEPPKAEPPKAEPPRMGDPTGAWNTLVVDESALEGKTPRPKAEPPKAEPPKAEPPKAEPPKPSEPAAVKRSTEAPKAEAPKAAEPARAGSRPPGRLGTPVPTAEGKKLPVVPIVVAVIAVIAVVAFLATRKGGSTDVPPVSEKSAGSTPPPAEARPEPTKPEPPKAEPPKAEPPKAEPPKAEEKAEKAEKVEKPAEKAEKAEKPAKAEKAEEKAKKEPPKKEEAAADKPLPRWLEIRSTPPGAAVYLDGKLVGYTPTTLRGPPSDLSRARKLVIKRPGYQEATLTTPTDGWKEANGKETQSLSTTLEQITTAPKPAEGAAGETP